MSYKYLSPDETIDTLENLVAVLYKPLQDLIICDGDIVKDTTFRYVPSEFNRAQKVRLLRANHALQQELEFLSTIIELTPFLFRKFKVSEYG